MTKIIRAALRRRTSTMLILLALGILGILTAAVLPVTELPPLGLPQATVAVALPGYPAREVRDLAALPVEEALGTLKGVRRISSVSRDGTALITVHFPWGKNMTRAAVEIRQLIGNIRGRLPAAAGVPQVLSGSPDTPPLMEITLFPRAASPEQSEGRAMAEIRRLADEPIRTALQQIPGVGSVTLTGGSEEEIRIEPFLSKLIQRGITPSDLANRISGETQNYPSGRITGASRETLLKIQSRLTHPEDLKALPLLLPGGETAAISELGRVVSGHREAESFHHHNGRPGISLAIRRRAQADPLETTARLQKEIRELQEIYRPVLSMQISRNSTGSLRRQRRDILRSVLISSLLVAGLLLLTGGGLRAALIPSLAIPLSLAATLLGLTLLGQNLNTMTLGGLAVGIGLLVDNSLVVLDALGGLPRSDIPALAEAAGRSTVSLLSSTLTTLAVFLPLFFLPGIMGVLYRGLALALSLSLISSLAVAPVLVPLLYHILPGKAPPRPRENSLLHRRCRRFLIILLRRPSAAAGGVILFLLAGALSVFFLDTEFFPPVNRNTLDLNASFPPGTRLPAIEEAAAGLAPALLDHPAVQTLTLQAGAEPDNTALLSREDYSPQALRGTLILDPKRCTRLEPLRRELVTLLREQTSLPVTLSRPPQILTPLLGVQPGTLAYRAILPQPEDLPRLLTLLRKLQGDGRIPGDAGIYPGEQKPAFKLYPARDRQLQGRSSSRETAGFLQSLTRGVPAAPLQIDGRLIPLRILPPKLRESDPSRILQIHQPSGRAPAFPPGEWLSLRRETAPSRCLRENFEDYLMITLNANGEEPSLSPLEKGGFSLERADLSVIQREAPRMAALFVLALFLVYVILGARFESFGLPLLLMILVPLSFLGGTLGLHLFGQTLNLSSFLGILVLLGLLVNNAILLTEDCRERSARNLPAAAAVYSGASRRLRPILITTGTTLLALLPLAVDPANRSAQSSLAAVILGGLSTASILTLLLLPLLLYSYLSIIPRRRRLSQPN